ncbi:protein ARV1 (ARV1) [Vairimorpha necatrix]|uniref:Protein ARV n=1 Tax=Vairimorpha necatrix TaxID=6039 RepID=A0AAX4JAQ1_9MICR
MKRKLLLSNVSMCINCGINLFDTKSDYECKSCHKKVDKYFEVSQTLLLIDLLLFKKPVLRHILFNKTMSLLIFLSYSSLLFILNIDFMLYFIFLIFFCKLKYSDLNKILLLSYYLFFNYLLRVWGYKGREYKLVVEFIVIVINSKGLGCINGSRVEDNILICFISRILSIYLFNIIKSSIF